VNQQQVISKEELLKKANLGKRGGEALLNVICALG
jgi:hypothetical protein